jgi:hypothetical protein
MKINNYIKYYLGITATGCVLLSQRKAETGLTKYRLRSAEREDLSM